MDMCNIHKICQSAASLCLARLPACYARVAIVHNVSKTGVTFPHCIALMRMITMNETVMILREGKMRGIIMMMKVIIGAIYLCRADVVARLLSPSWSQMIFPSNTCAYTRTRFTLAHTNTVSGSSVGPLP